MFEETRELFGEYEATPMKKYVLTGKRNLIRILDIGLIVPELVACSVSRIAFFTENNLGEITSVELAPSTPVLLEISGSTPNESYILGVENITAIHFANEEEKESYLARPFENVPNQLFQFKATPSLFNLEQKKSNVTFDKLDKKLLTKNYRNADSFLALFWQYIEESASAVEVRDVISSLTNQKRAIFSNLNTLELIERAAKIEIEPEVASILYSYFAIISTLDIERGWVSKDVFELLKVRLEESDGKSEIFEKWCSFTEAILNNEKELIALTDEKQIALRAILLHLLNPDLESINRIAARESFLGQKVLSVARILAVVRDGFSAMHAERKEANPGAYFLLSGLIANAMIDSEYDLSGLTIIEESGGEREILKWNNAIVGEYSLMQSPAKGKTNETLNKDNTNSSELSDTNLKELVATLEGIKIIEKVTVIDDDILIDINKKRIQPVTLPKHAQFSLKKEGNDWFVITRLLDFSIASHIKKLTNSKMRSALIYQTEQSRGFYFDFLVEDRFQASIRASDLELNKVGLEKIILKLIDVHVWMKST